MPRPKIARQICGRPANSCFKPNGRPMHQLEQVKAALVMGVSRQTLANILKKGRYKVVECLSMGKALMMQSAEPDHQTSGEEPQ